MPSGLRSFVNNIDSGVQRNWVEFFLNYEISEF